MRDRTLVPFCRNWTQSPGSLSRVLRMRSNQADKVGGQEWGQHRKQVGGSVRQETAHRKCLHLPLPFLSKLPESLLETGASADPECVSGRAGIPSTGKGRPTFHHRLGICTFYSENGRFLHLCSPESVHIGARPEVWLCTISQVWEKQAVRAELCPPNAHVQVLSPCDCVWGQGS